MLLNPKVNQEDSKFGVYHFDGLKKKCKLGFVSVLENNALRRSEDTANEIFNKLKAL